MAVNTVSPSSEFEVRVDSNNFSTSNYSKPEQNVLNLYIDSKSFSQKTIDCTKPKLRVIPNKIIYKRNIL